MKRKVGTTLEEALYLRAKEAAREQQYGLLVNDSLVPLHMHKMGLSLLASADTAFDRIPWVRRAGPSDI